MTKYFSVFCILVAMLVCGACSKSEQSKTGPILPNVTANQAGASGQTELAFSNLAGTDEKSHSLNDYADAKAVVVVFTCNECPVAKAYEDRLVKFATDYKDKGVQLVAINVNNIEADKLPAMKVRAAEKGFIFPYLYDPSQVSARAYGATVTPHVFVLDTSRKVVFAGAIDDNMDESKVSQNYVRDAVDAVLSGGEPAVASIKPVGCGIKYE